MTGSKVKLDLTIFTRLSEAGDDWQQLKAVGRSNPYHSAEWLEAWTDTLGHSLNISPIIAVGRINRNPVVILPLGVERSTGISTLRFLGHQHGNQNTGVWDAAFYDAADPADLGTFLKEICRQTHVDLLTLENIPCTWHGRVHPLLFKDGVPSPSPIFVRQLSGPFDDLFRDTHSKSSRKNLLRKERHLQTAGGYRVMKANTKSEIETGLSVFLEQRATRAREAGIPNVFDSPAAKAFLARALGLTQENAARSAPMDLWYLETGGVIRATYLCLEDAGTLYAYSNSIAHDDMLPNSPGLVLIKDIIARACENPRLQTLDLGLGEERYKTSWAEAEPLADILLATTAKGALKQNLVAALLRAKSEIRGSKVLWPIVRRLRQMKAGLR